MTPGPRRPRCRSPSPSGGPGSWRTAAARYAREGSRRRGTSSSHCQSTPLTARKKGGRARTRIRTTTTTQPHDSRNNSDINTIRCTMDVARRLSVKPMITSSPKGKVNETTMAGKRVRRPKLSLINVREGARDRRICCSGSAQKRLMRLADLKLRLM